MTSDEYKKFTVQARHGIKGEAFFESLISEHAIPHHVSGLKDIGVDYFCEWVHGDKPTGVLFAVQVKTVTMPDKIISLGWDENKNLLEKFEIKNSIFSIEPKTQSYWRGLFLPVYLFVIIISDSADELTAYYQRFTGILHKPGNASCAIKNSEFYKVSKGDKFLAFGDEQNKSCGFARDLFIDYIRCNYYKGSIVYLNPREIGLEQFPKKDNIFCNLYKEYKDKIDITFSSFESFKRRYDGKHPPSLASPDVSRVPFSHTLYPGPIVNFSEDSD